MIPGDEGKVMSIMELISDEPCDPLPYTSYLLRDYRGRLEEWSKPATDGREREAEIVCFWLRRMIDGLEELERKFERLTPEQFRASRP